MIISNPALCRPTIQLSYIPQESRLNRSTGDEEPLVDAAVDRSRRQVLALGEAGDLGLLDTVGGVVGDVGTIPVSYLLAGNSGRLTG